MENFRFFAQGPINRTNKQIIRILMLYTSAANTYIHADEKAKQEIAANGRPVPSDRGSVYQTCYERKNVFGE